MTNANLQRSNDHSLQPKSPDPDELVSNGIGSIFVGDGFLMVAVFLSISNSAVSSLLWLLLLLPAFFFFGKGFKDVLYAQQIRRRLKQDAVTGAFPPPRATIEELIADSDDAGAPDHAHATRQLE